MNPQPGRTLLLQTYDGEDIPNSIDADLSADAIWHYKRWISIGDQARQLTPATGRYNCHGLVFASRRTNIPPVGGPNDVNVDDLLARDEYEKVQGSLQPGDVVVYRDRFHDIQHSGIVSRVDPLGEVPVIRVISKWGAGPEYEHHPQLTPFEDCSLEYWRLKA